MASRPKHKMPPSVRAKQFAPFAALKGFEEALREKENIYVKRKEIYEEKADELNEALKTVSVGDAVTVNYYKNRQYVDLTGVVDKFDLTLKFLEISDEHITFDNIFEIRKLD